MLEAKRKSPKRNYSETKKKMQGGDRAAQQGTAYSTFSYMILSEGPQDRNKDRNLIMGRGLRVEPANICRMFWNYLLQRSI